MIHATLKTDFSKSHFQGNCSRSHTQVVLSNKKRGIRLILVQIKAESVLFTMIPITHIDQNVTCSLFCVSASHIWPSVQFSKPYSISIMELTSRHVTVCESRAARFPMVLKLICSDKSVRFGLFSVIVEGKCTNYRNCLLQIKDKRTFIYALISVLSVSVNPFLLYHLKCIKPFLSDNCFKVSRRCYMESISLTIY